MMLKEGRTLYETKGAGNPIEHEEIKVTGVDYIAVVSTEWKTRVVELEQAAPHTVVDELREAGGRNY